jgi:hypothetical protein
MAEPTPVESIGIRVFYSTTLSTYVSNSAWTEVEGIRDVTPPTTGKVENKECTTHGNAATDKRKRYTQGLIEPSDWSFKQVYSKTGYDTLQALVRVKKGWKVVFSDGSTYYSDSWITEGKPDAPIDGFMEAEWSLFNFGPELFSTTS